MKQRSRINWIKEGDSNTKFFHAQIKRRINNNHVARIWNNGVCTTDPVQLRQLFAKHFEDRFREHEKTKYIQLGSLQLSRIDTSDATSLEMEFTDEEISVALDTIHPDKAPGPDGFKAKYIKSMWKFLHTDFKLLLNFFHSNAYLPPGINSSFLTLIPKVDQPSLLIDFRPISLINTSMKIILKILANKFKKFLPNLVAEEQSAFVQGRNISESILITNEIAHSIQNSHTKGLILKLDFEKAFDMVNWEFLLQTLNSMGFGVKWLAWIKEIFSTVRQSVLVNGSPSTEFKMERGLRQGDPLSPMLFIIVTQVLHVVIEKAKTLGLIKGIRIGNLMSISHLQFADDTIIFLQDDWHSIKGIKLVLTIFEMLSGLKINYSKSSIYAPASPQYMVQAWAAWLNCKQGTLPFTYLGATIGASCKRKSFWKPLTKKVSMRLARWRCNTLSKQGRLTLINAVVDALPLYWTTLYRLPKGTVAEIEKVKRRFLWRVMGETDKIQIKLHLVNWQTICKSKIAGGLGVTQLDKKNSTMLAKWWWKAKTESNKLWFKTLKAKYGDQFLTEPKIARNDISPIMQSISQSQSGNHLKLYERKDYSWILGDGATILFWKDHWYGDQSLDLKFNRLYL